MRYAFSIADFAEAIGVSHSTVRRKIYTGEINTIPGSDPKKISVYELHRYLGEENPLDMDLYKKITQLEEELLTIKNILRNMSKILDIK